MFFAQFLETYIFTFYRNFITDTQRKTLDVHIGDNFEQFIELPKEVLSPIKRKHNFFKPNFLPF